MGSAHESSNHWRHKRKYRPDISDDMLLTVIIRGRKMRDSQWVGVLNSVGRVSPSGRRLKIVYKILGRKRYRIITAYWLD